MDSNQETKFTKNENKDVPNQNSKGESPSSETMKIRKSQENAIDETTTKVDSVIFNNSSVYDEPTIIHSKKLFNINSDPNTPSFQIVVSADDDGREVDKYGFYGGTQYTNPSQEANIPLEVLRVRELKWIDMLDDWDKWMAKKFQKVKERCRKGIPSSMRAHSWQMLSGSAVCMYNRPGEFQRFLKLKGSETCLEDIRKDVHRIYPHHELFINNNGQGQEDLFNVLKAYSIYQPSVGYCQAQGPIAAVLLTVMPVEQAFWCFGTICDKYMEGYFDPGLEAVQIDGMVMFSLMKKVSPQTYRHLKSQKVDPLLYMTEWFMCLFSRTLPWPTLLRIWDMFMCEGIKVIFKVALVLVKSVLGDAVQLKRCSTVYDTLEKLKKIPAEYMQQDYLVKEILKLSINEKDMEKEHEKQVKIWKHKKQQQQQQKNEQHTIRQQQLRRNQQARNKNITNNSSEIRGDSTEQPHTQKENDKKILRNTTNPKNIKQRKHAKIFSKPHVDDKLLNNQTANPFKNKFLVEAGDGSNSS
ncbi:hypothetical protein HELRODRAFT_188085 [Helobdella robusta]|uniref:Rab-GAP TBC domain-containing protein n=1 Tax=Helobdella robusta TaxID=6412 RepID=T1FPL9_HELRO|nr:hypothetical protein HELRODRAFT_188085 [Helobdella robusta]ESO13048.1 hypothetical protein HELRODRAFT_188085 [Helobdella robusta]